MKRIGLCIKHYAATITNAVTTRAPIANPTFTGTISNITKAMGNLGSVDNASDVNKPVSTITQATVILKTYAADVASNFKLQGPLLWYFDPATPIATQKISLDLNNIAPEANLTVTRTLNGTTKNHDKFS